MANNTVSWGLIPGVSSPTANLPVGSLYNLYATDSNGRGTIPFDVNWATGPNITSQVTVSTSAALLSAVSTPGTEVTVQAGTYSTIQGVANDVHIILQPGVYVNSSTLDFSGPKGAYFGGQRQKLTGAGTASRIEGGFHSYSSVLDLTISEAEFVPVGSSLSSLGTGWCDVHVGGGSRISIISSRFTTTNTGSSSYGFFTQQPMTDLIVANTYFHNSGAIAGAVRLADAGTRIIWVDNYVYSTTGYAAFRYHNAGQYLWMRNNQFENNTTGMWLDTNTAPQSGPGAQSDIWIYDDNWYGVPSGDQILRLDIRDNATYPVTNLTMDGCTYYTAEIPPFVVHGDPVVDGTGEPTWNIGTNLNQPLTTPPTWVQN